MKNLAIKIIILAFAFASMIYFVPELSAQNKNPQNNSQTGDRYRQQKRDGSCVNNAVQKNSRKQNRIKKQNKNGNKKGFKNGGKKNGFKNGNGKGLGKRNGTCIYR